MVKEGPRPSVQGYGAWLLLPRVLGAVLIVLPGPRGCLGQVVRDPGTCSIHNSIFWEREPIMHKAEERRGVRKKERKRASGFGVVHPLGLVSLGHAPTTLTCL
jgi:hypothetical protein